MTSNFSGAVKLVNLSDYIAPSQACVVTLSAKKKSDSDSDTKPQLAPQQNGLVQLQEKPRFNQAAPAATDAPVKVTLHDCLACSGCVTSAETVMLEQQSVDEFLARLAKADMKVIVSVSPQSRASLAAHYDLTPLQAFKKLSGFLKSLGVTAVFDTSCSRDVTLIEACEEFVARFRESGKLGQMNGSSKAQRLPLLASACPGWICYAEKTHGKDVLPFISTVKSPQQVMGSILKRHAFQALGLKPEEIHHVTIMPCYDKKLEASRDDFLFATGDGSSVIEVDSVLTSGEILNLLESRGVDFPTLEEVPLDRMLTNVGENELLYGVRGGSGGYVDTIFRYAARTLFQEEVLGQLEYKTIRNSDFTEISLEKDGSTVLKFACAYGFRNIQNLVRKIKTRKSEYDFVEIMACPSGCLNGGGQIKPMSGQSAKELIQDLERRYLEEVDVKDPFSNPVARALYDEWLGQPLSLKAQEALHTSYHSVEKSIVSQLHDW